MRRLPVPGARERCL